MVFVIWFPINIGHIKCAFANYNLQIRDPLVDLGFPGLFLMICLNILLYCFERKLFGIGFHLRTYYNTCCYIPYNQEKTVSYSLNFHYFYCRYNI
jgi:hypothetical protein